MLDITGILFSSIMMLIVIVRAVKLDKTQPWFQMVAVARPAEAKPATRPGRPRG